VLAEAIEHVTGRRLADVLGDLLWSRAGAEGDAAILVNERGEPIAHGGICLRLRDLARFGLLFTATGARDAAPPITPAILRRFDTTGRPELLRKGHPEWIHHANYQWDAVGTKGELTKGGFGGQLLYIDRERDVVVAYFGTNTTLDKEAPPLPLRTLLARYFDAANQ
jgi:CubicO group peptidase (beta-lactamase class C family)